MIDDWKRRNRVECTLYVDIDEESLADGVKTAVFRSVQEALTNVSRHACGSEVEINLVADGQTLHFSITDHGCGIEPGAENKLTSFGLLGMRERIEALGGELEIKSVPGKGTQLEGSIPLTAQRNSGGAL
jgi:signal transduction histidine kinase